MLTFLELSEPADQAKKDAGKAPLRQMIFSITMYDWKRTIETFGIKKSIIPTRQKEVLTLGATGWYT